MLLNVKIRPENQQDSHSIHSVITAAFENHPHSNHKEQLIVEQLRQQSALSVSLVAEHEGKIIGHIAFSKVKIGAKESAWYGLAPVAVSPEYQSSGVGSQLINAGLNMIKSQQAEGCVLLGEPGYYERFGFKANHSLTLEGVPPEYFLAMSFSSHCPVGKVEFHQAFTNNG